MSRVSVEVFLALEASLTARLSSTFSALMSELLPAIGDAVRAEQFDAARRLLDQMDLDAIYVLNENYIRYVSHVAMLFGASRVTDDPVNSAVGLGFERELVDQVMSSFRVCLSVNGEDAIKAQALQLIAFKENPPVPEPSYLGTVLKAAKPSAVLPFESFMESAGKTFFNTASSLHTSRLSAFGYTAEANYLGITHYQIDEQLDGRTCPVCAHMDGKTFLVSDARNLLDIVVRTQDPDELTNLQPWPKQNKAAMDDFKQLSNDKLVSNGWHIPPFHPRCRGLLSKSTSKVATSSQVASPLPLQEYEASAEDFDQLGTPLSPARIKLWNQLMQTSPSEVVSRITGTPVEDLISAGLADGPTAQNLGIKTLAVNSNGVNLELLTTMHGSTNPVGADLYFRKDKTLFVGSVEVSPEDGANTLKSTLKAIYGLARSTSMERIKMTAGADMGGYAFAKYGLAPDIEAWDNVKAQITRFAKKSNMMDLMDETEKKLFNAVMASDDPRDIFALADMPNFGKAFLSGTTYTTYLDFNDAESITRFLAHIAS